ncbi:MAG: hypothetical protein LC113_07135 [Acidobacteria bacterium]|nr:hypothetical protein [Acidobacteriota bacterium]
MTATGEITVFIYSSGKLAAEYSTSAPVADPQVSYTTTDHLGSPRVITDALGQVTSRRDFLPFGEEIAPNVGSRTASLKYGTADTIRQKFTGYQKDAETSLDFAQARMYDNRFGRFTAVDPLLASGKSANPQTFNRYAYVGNSPLVVTDPSGLDWYRRYNEETKRWEYQEQGGDGWEHITEDTTQVEDWCWNGTCYNTTAYLYRSGGWDFGQTPGSIVGQFLKDEAIGIGKWGYNTLAGVSNGFYTVAGYATWDFVATGNPRSMPYVSYYEYSNGTQRGAANGMTIGSIIIPGLGETPKPFPAALPEGFSAVRSVGTTGAVDATQFEQYALRAAREGMYPVMQRGSKKPVGEVFLKQGDVWKFGQTKNGVARYPGSFYRNTGKGLEFSSEFKTSSFKDVIKMERQQILNYEQQFGKLPPGNKIRR